ncbi:MAG: peroxide stress protein YaaA [Deltaproteobacteria bacterium]|nr:peroxide stress protein YaaA [Deltaproteobacteria bacterium]
MADPGFRILIAPSERKAPGGTTPWSQVKADPKVNRFAELAGERDRVATALKQAITAKVRLADLFDLKGKALEKAIETNLDLANAPTMTALERYAGDMYAAIDPSSLPSDAVQLFKKAGLIVSGLLGIVTPGDLIPDYKLKIGAQLPDVGPLTRYWKGELAHLWIRELKGRGVLDLLPEEHAKTIAPPSGAIAWVQVKFGKTSGKGSKVRFTSITHGAKVLRGQLVRSVLEAGKFDPKGWSRKSPVPKFKVSKELSSYDGVSGEIVFVQG